eukprot:126515_1
MVLQSAGPDSESTISERFKRALNFVQSSPKGSLNLNNDQLLVFYATFKQATSGDVSGRKPSFTKFIARKKWLAWKELASTSRNRAMEMYIEALEQKVPNWESKERSRL